MVDQVGTPAVAVNSTAASTIDLTLTVPSGATLLLVGAGIRNNPQTLSSIEDWDVGQSFDFIGETNPDDANAQYLRLAAVVSPTAQANTITFTFSGSASWQYAWAVSYDGTSVVSVAAATNVLETVDNTTGSATTVFASDGSSSNAIVAACGLTGADGEPVSNNASFNERVETNTGGGAGGNADATIYVADLLTGLPSGCTVTWSASDDNAGIYLELVAAASGINTIIIVPTGPPLS